jgi:hypothetical protein
MPWKDIPLYPIPKPKQITAVSNASPMRITVEGTHSLVDGERVMIDYAVLGAGTDNVNTGVTARYVDVIDSSNVDIYFDSALSFPVDNTTLSGAAVWISNGAIFPFQESRAPTGTADRGQFKWIVNGEIYALISNPGKPTDEVEVYRMVKLIGESFVELDPGSANRPDRLSYSTSGGLTVRKRNLIDGIVIDNLIYLVWALNLTGGGGPNHDVAYALQTFDTDTEQWGVDIDST